MVICKSGKDTSLMLQLAPDPFSVLINNSFAGIKAVTAVGHGFSVIGDRLAAILVNQKHDFRGGFNNAKR